MGKRKGVLLAAPYSKKKLDRWLGETQSVFAQPKLNGERLIWNGYQLFTSEGNLCESLPHIMEELAYHWSNFPLDGEAYRHGWSRQRIHSVVSRTVNLHEEHLDIFFYVFDVPTAQLKQASRLMALQKAGDRYSRTPHIIPVPTHTAASHEQLETYTTSLVRHGYEGSITRHPLGEYKYLSRRWMMKWKPGGRDTYKLIEMLEGKGKYKGSLGALIVEAQNGDRFHVGSFKVNDRERARLWADRVELEGKCLVQVRYTELTDRGVPPSGVFEVIVK